MKLDKNKKNYKQNSKNKGQEDVGRTKRKNERQTRGFHRQNSKTRFLNRLSQYSVYEYTGKKDRVRPKTQNFSRKRGKRKRHGRRIRTRHRAIRSRKRRKTVHGQIQIFF